MGQSPFDGQDSSVEIGSAQHGQLAEASSGVRRQTNEEQVTFGRERGLTRYPG